MARILQSVIGKSDIGQSLIGEFSTLPANADYLASVCGRLAGKSSAGGETAGTEPERNAAAEPQTEARR